jgi:hypothetical protein
MIRMAKRPVAKLATLLGALSFAVVLSSGCSADLPTAPEALSSSDDCYLINGRWVCPYDV